MKRITLIVVCLLLSSLLFAQSAFTYSVSQMGEKSSSDSFGSLSLSLGFTPIKEKHYSLVETNVLLGWNKFFRGIDFVISSPLFTSSNEVFSYAFSNTVLWEPTVGFMASYRQNNGKWMLGALFSPFKFVDTSFSYEFLSPYILFGFDGEKAYGVRIMKVSAFLGV